MGEQQRSKRWNASRGDPSANGGTIQRWETRTSSPIRSRIAAAINAWANSKDPKAGMRAEAILQRMEKQYKMGNEDVKPDTITYNTAITAWANSEPNAGMRAEAILQRMEEQYKMGNEDVKPNTITYNSASHCMGKQSRSRCWYTSGGDPSANGRTIQDGKRGRQAQYDQL